jgi:hypothetical protein
MRSRGSPPLEKRPDRPALWDGLRPFGDTGQAPGRRRTRFLALAFTAAAHLAVFIALFLAQVAHIPPPDKPSPSLLLVSVAAQPKAEAPAPPDATKTEDAASRQPTMRPTPPRPAAPAPAATSTPAPDTSDLLSEAQLAGAASAGEGGSGGCDVAQVVQQALRRDPLVRTAVEDAHRLGKAIMLWNGDWVQSVGQDGKGLSAVREAVMWVVAFAPQACRDERVHGLVLLSLGDGGTRFAIGSGDWRWSDLLGVRRGPYGR